MISCLHTAHVHVETFGGLIADAHHVVREDLLERARTDGVASVRDEVVAVLKALAKDGPVLCTCSTLGPLVDELGDARVLRIDRPAMAQAVAAGGEIVVAICLESTRDATLALFDDVSGGHAQAKLVLCDQAWPYFEEGDMAAFSAEIHRALTGQGQRVLLAQASMAVAADALRADGCEVFTTPQAAAQAVLGLD